MTDVYVLIVDDEEGPRTLVARLLETESFAVTQAGGVKEATLLIDQNVYDVIILDIVMDNDEKAGVELLRQIRERGGHTKVILLTGHATLDTAMRAVNLGAFGYIEKPVMDHRGELVDRVHAAIDAICQEAAKRFAPYDEIFKEVWDRTVGLVGPVTLSAIFRNVLAELEERWPCLKNVVVGVDGVSICALLKSRIIIDHPDRTRQALNELIAELVRFLADLTGEEDLRAVLGRPILKKEVAGW